MIRKFIATPQMWLWLPIDVCSLQYPEKKSPGILCTAIKKDTAENLVQKRRKKNQNQTKKNKGKNKTKNNRFKTSSKCLLPIAILEAIIKNHKECIAHFEKVRVMALAESIGANAYWIV